MRSQIAQKRMNKRDGVQKGYRHTRYGEYLENTHGREAKRKLSPTQTGSDGQVRHPS